MLGFGIVKFGDDVKDLAETEINHFISFLNKLFITDEVCIV